MNADVKSEKGNVYIIIIKGRNENISTPPLRKLNKVRADRNSDNNLFKHNLMWNCFSSLMAQTLSEGDHVDGVDSGNEGTGKGRFNFS